MPYLPAAWRPAGPEKAQLFSSHYYVKPDGNCDLSQRSDPHGEFGGKNCLIARKTTQETAQLAGEASASPG